MNITKTDYLEYTFCKKNLWLKKHKPELFKNVELSDFEKKIIEEGNLADEEARHLFSGGILVDSYGNALYIMFNNWEELSQKSRVELLNGNEDSFKRIVHNPGWEDKFIKIVEKYKANIIKK